MATHRIRLVGPWDFQWQESTGFAGPPVTHGTMKMPCRWQDVFGSFDGTATFTRKFHCPTNLEPHERVFIVLSGVPGHGSASLNGAPLGLFDAPNGETEFDATQRLAKFNLLEMTVRFSPSTMSVQTDGPLAEVALEIRSD